MRPDTVHIECTSMDDNLEKFLTNPEQAGEKNPLWLKYTPARRCTKRMLQPVHSQRIPE